MVDQGVGHGSQNSIYPPLSQETKTKSNKTGWVKEPSHPNKKVNTMERNRSMKLPPALSGSHFVHLSDNPQSFYGKQIHSKATHLPSSTSHLPIPATKPMQQLTSTPH
jgi:hypothetical protein